MKQNPIAIRKLYDINDKSRTFNAMIYAPVKAPDGMYRCLLKLEGAPGELAEMNAAGVDSYQALQCALRFLHVHVKVFNGKNHMQGRLRWVDDAETDLGFSISTD